MKGCVTFRIYPDGEKDNYYTAFIFKTKAAMTAFQCKTTEGVKWGSKYKDMVDSECEAITYSWGTPRGQEAGQVLFWTGSCNARIVSHEFTHAALYWIKNHGVKATHLYTRSAADERLAWTQGEMTGEFWVEYWKKKKRTDWL